MRLSAQLIVFGALSVALGTGLGSCTGSEPDTGTDKPFEPISLTRAESEVVASTNAFAYRLLSKSDPKDGNVIQSPLSVATALGMLANGAQGETREELLSLLGGGDMETLNSCCRILGQRLPEADNRVSMCLANSMWLDNGFNVKEQYAATLRDVFKAEAFNTDLGSAKGMERINKWCDDATSGMIPKFLENPLDGRIALINAVYFNGSWKKPFDKEKTRNLIFTNADGSTTSTPMMHAYEQYLGYAADELGEAVRLPYGNEAFYMELVLPRQGTTPRDVAAAYASGNHAEPEFTTATVNLALPKFKIESKLDLIEPLRNLGAANAFSSNADFSLISDSKPAFNLIRHKAVIEVDEEGAKAAAVTGALMASSPGTVGELITLEFNRPFLFMIKERSTNAVVFTGIVRKL